MTSLGRDDGTYVNAGDVRWRNLGWGRLGWRCTPTEGATRFVVMDVVLEPGGAHDFHRHPSQEQLVVVRRGLVEQWVGRKRRRMRAGDSVFTPPGVVHATFNDTDEEGELQLILGPAVGESGYEFEDLSHDAPWCYLRPSQ